VVSINEWKPEIITFFTTDRLKIFLGIGSQSLTMVRFSFLALLFISCLVVLLSPIPSVIYTFFLLLFSSFSVSCSSRMYNKEEESLIHEGGKETRRQKR
jgi:hypothetical protein